MDYHGNLVIELIKQEIFSKRSEHEKWIDEQSFISLSDEDQQICMDLEDREKAEYAAVLGFKIGSYVVNSKGEHFRVRWVIDPSWLKNIDSMSISLIPENSEEIAFSVYTRTANVFHLTERNYMDQYKPDPDYIPSLLFLEGFNRNI